jgi:hypothetical protein
VTTTVTLERGESSKQLIGKGTSQVSGQFSSVNFMKRRGGHRKKRGGFVRFFQRSRLTFSLFSTVADRMLLSLCPDGFPETQAISDILFV